jgi:hypothetical protein
LYVLSPLLILIQQLAGVGKVAWHGLVGKGSFGVPFEIYHVGAR